MPPSLSIVIPFRDEAGSLPTLYGELARVVARLDYETEMIFVDDESRDGGAALLLDAATGDRRLRVLSIVPHSGQSAALAAGFLAARGEIIATLDADLQNDPADLPRMLAALEEVDCVNGIRIPRRDRITKRLASRFANGFRQRILGDEVTDIGCSLRVMRAESLRRIKLFRGSHRFLPVLLALEGARILELPVNHRPRRHGSSNYAIGERLFETFFDLMAVFWMKHRVARYEVKEWARRL